MKRLVFIAGILCFSICLKAQEDRNYDGSWNRPTFSGSNFGYKYVFFGKTEPRNRHPMIEESTIPPIPGLKYRSCYSICPKDTCRASRAILAMRCPEDAVLLNWASSRAACMAKWCESGMYIQQQPINYSVGKSSADICNKYISKIHAEFDLQECFGDSDMPNEQFGFLLTDCWRTEKYCTFFEATWYDMLSCGDTTRESYYSVDLINGKVATLADFVPEAKWPALAEMMLQYLRSGNGELYKVPTDALNLLKDLDGCALIREGLVIYYYPYHIGCGADGEFKAVIPYKKLITL